MSLRFGIFKNGQDYIRNRICESIVSTFLGHGHQLVPLHNELNFVINHTNLKTNDHYYRKSRNEWIISILHLSQPVDDLKSQCYTALIRTLSNMVITIIPAHNNSGFLIYCVTPEVGFYHFIYDPERVYECMLPIVTSHILLKNHVVYDLPPAYWQPTPSVESLIYHGKKLDRLGLLPQPFPIEKLLSQDDLEHLYQFFQIKGISYGNLSVREAIPGIAGDTFWMTARGVNKGALSQVGKDILLVSGFDKEKQAITVHTIPGVDAKARVSVDAIEHHLIYNAFPKVKAILHVHAWMENISSTFQNYPCGTLELANSVVEKIRISQCPESTVVGLKNHGITITGSSLEEIFERIRGKLIPKVPMFE